MLLSTNSLRRNRRPVIQLFDLPSSPARDFCWLWEQTYRHNGNLIDYIHRAHRFTDHVAPRAGRLLTADSTTRPASPALFFVLTLAFAVCFWGLHYKLSLYHSAAARPAVPAAKLLSQKERPVSFNDVDFVRPVSPQTESSIFFPTFLLAAIVFSSHLVLLRWIRTVTTDGGCRQQNCAKSHCLSPRPPPARLLSC